MSQAGSTSSGGGGGGDLNTLTPDVGGAVSPDGSGTIFIHGAGGITTTNTGSNGLTITQTSGVLQTSTVILTSTQVKNLGTTPVTLVAAQGANQYIIPYEITFKLTYGGTNPFTNAGGASASLDYYDGVSVFEITGGIIQDFVTATEDVICFLPVDSLGTPVAGSPIVQVNNLPIVLDNLTVGINYGGNAANDNTLTVAIQYVVLTL